MNNPFKDIPNYIGVAASLSPNDSRLAKYKAQYDEQGWDDTITWNLYAELCVWMLPKLKRFKEITICHPADLTEEGWDIRLQVMIHWMELVVEDKCPYTEEDKKIMAEGLKLFKEYFYDLWW